MRPFKFFEGIDGLYYPTEIGGDPFLEMEYNEGWCASIEGRHCPYDLGTRSHQVWSRGYNDQRESRRRQLIELTNMEDETV